MNKNRMKKWMAVFLIMCLVLGVSACGQSNEAEAEKQQKTAEQKEEKAPDETEAVEGTETAVREAETADGEAAHKIGFICWSYNGALEQSYKRTMEKLAEELQFEVEFAEGSSNEDVLAAVENLIENGCEGILATTAPPTMMELCNQSGVYFVQYSNNVDEETKEEFEKSEYWLGYVTDNDELAGYNGVKAMYDQGCREIGLMATSAGMQTNHDNRYAGMLRAAEELDMTYYEYRGIDFVNAVQNFCTLYPDLDSIFCTTAASGLLDAYVQTIDSCGMAGQVKIGTFDIPDNASVYLEEGSYCFAAGGQFPDAELCVALLLNALNGTRLNDGPVYASSAFVEIKSSEDLENYNNYVAGETLPYTAEEIKGLLLMENPDASAEDLIQYAENYSIENVMERHGN